MRRLLPFAILLFFAGLRAPLLEPEEARYAEIPRQMLAADRWLIPTLNGQDYLDKPPLFYWLVMVAYRVVGVHDWAARIVAGSIAVLTVAVVYEWGRRVGGRRVAFAAGLVLLLTPEFAYRGRFVTMNGLLALCTTAALAAGQIALSDSSLRGRGRWWLASALCAGFGLLTKGPVALALVVPPLVLLGWRRVGIAYWCVYGLVAVAVAAPWFVAVAWQRPEFVGYFFWFHHVVRYTNAFDHAKPWWAYLPQLAVGLLPWSLLLPLAIRRLRSRRFDATFGLIAGAWMVLFFSLAGSKRPVYLVPALPPLALALGREAALLARRFSHRRIAIRWATATTCAAMFGGVAFVWPGYAERFSLRRLALATGDGPVVCYPQPWEALTFYGRGDVRVCRDRDELAAALDEGATLVAKTSRLGDLPAGWAFTPTAEATGVTAGRAVSRPSTR